LYVEKYVQHINFDMEKHNNIIAGLKIAKERHLITVAIRNFIDSEMYDILLELKEQFGSKTGVSDSEAI